METDMVNFRFNNILSAPPLQIHHAAGRSKHLNVVFSGVGQIHEEQPPIEFFKLATEDGLNHALFISDISRSWLNHETIDAQIIATVEKVTHAYDISTISMIGNSMGASMALFLRDRICAQTVLAFTPQFSIMHRFVPEEKRWRRYRNAIKQYKYPKVSGATNPDQRVYIVHGGTSDELAHALRFPNSLSRYHFIVPQFGHRLASKLKQQGILPHLVSAAVHDRPYVFRRTIEREGALLINKFRQSHPQ